MTILVTGAAGFVGMHVAQALLGRGEEVAGLDELNAYYDPTLKRARLERLQAQPGFTFLRADIAEEGDTALARWAEAEGPRVTGVVHLAAQAGVRYSLENPMAYARANLLGYMAVLELCR